MTAPCWRCGAAGSCEHRDVEPPVIPTSPTGAPKRYEPRERKVRDYSGQGLDFRAKRRAD